MGIEPFDFSFEVDGVFMTSGADKAIDTALKAVRAGGKILVFSSTPLSNGYPNNEIYYKELTVLGSYSPSPADLKDSLTFLLRAMLMCRGLQLFIHWIKYSRLLTIQWQIRFLKHISKSRVKIFIPFNFANWV